MSKKHLIYGGNNPEYNGKNKIHKIPLPRKHKFKRATDVSLLANLKVRKESLEDLIDKGLSLLETLTGKSEQLLISEYLPRFRNMKKRIEMGKIENLNGNELKRFFDSKMTDNIGRYIQEHPEYSSQRESFLECVKNITGLKLECKGTTIFHVNGNTSSNDDFSPYKIRPIDGRAGRGIKY